MSANGKKSDDGRELKPKLRFPEFRNAQGWQPKEFHELFSIGNGKDYKHLSPGNVPVYGSGGYMLSVNDYLHDGESVCIGRKGTINNPMFLSGKFWTVDTLFYTHSFNQCLPKFIYSIFQSIDWLKHNEAGGVPSLSKTNIERIKVLIPELKEQKRIADCLLSVDELIAAEAWKLEVLSTHKKGLMQRLFPCVGETQPRLRFPEFKDAGEWKPKSIGQLGEVVTGSTPSTARPEYYGGDWQLVSPADISDDRFIDKTKTTLTSLGFEETRPIKAYSILFVCIGSTIGKIAQNRYECATNQQINSIVPDSNYSDGFVYYALSGMADEIANLAGIQAVPIVNKSLFSSIELLVPKLPEQTRIADCLSSLDETIYVQTQRLDALKTHKKGMTQQLFPSAEEAL
jgi:type I restriction enzyme, S subunit